jgi:Zn-dependent peptidase ImmA (M78 family)
MNWDPPHRQARGQTFAHELGHLLLNTDENLHVDKNFPIGLRNGISGKSIDGKEIEANQFAAALLMPSDFIAEDVRLLTGIDVLIAIRKLASKYRVSEQAMSIRLSVLGYVALGT